MRNSSSMAAICWHPIHAMLISFPAACFVGAFITDIAYWRSMSFIWVTFSVWLLTAGLVVAGVAVVAGLVDFVSDHSIRNLRSGWIHALGKGLVVALSVINVFVHSRDGYTAVVPTGIILSGIVVLIMLITSWIGEKSAYQYRVGVIN
jgi:uncharacterized membrane protein